MNWVIKSKHKNEEERTIALELEDQDGTFDANIRWDGCMEIHIRSKTEEDNVLVDTIHTCDIDGLISKLEGLKQACLHYLDDFKQEAREEQEDK
ncbi:hypothetical protein [Aneurinibacillus tyrosinisolvens]|uniref:hypothetical protein n=1 Tax=Aneurinibacillus tyrosinisolvens TaxID=1443435 RepID=UPI00063F3372|nr:hypothetical protein [Aneurinibacillus tyrosinisolvens]